MAVALSSLRVSAEIDAGAYVRGMAQKVAADKEGASSSREVAAAVAVTTVRLNDSGGIVGRLSRSYVDGYGSAQKFRSEITALGKAIETSDRPLANQDLILEGIYRKYGLTADAMKLAEAGQLKLAASVASLNERYAVQAEVAARAATAQSQMAMAARAQAEINARLGVRDDFGGAARAADIAAYGKALDDVRAKYVPLFAAQRAYIAELNDINAALKAGALGEREAAAARQVTKDAFAQQVLALRGINPAATSAAGALKLTANETQMITYQINDLATQLASGSSPFMAIAQQGGQIVQVFGKGTGVVAALKAVGLAAVEFLSNPLTLAVIGLAAVAAIVPRVFRAIISGSGSATVSLEQHKAMVDEIKAAYQQAQSSAEGWSDAVLKTTRVQAEDNLKARIDEYQKLLQKIQSVPQGLGQRSAEIGNPYADLYKQFEQLDAQLKTGQITVAEYRHQLDLIAQVHPEVEIHSIASSMMSLTGEAYDAEAAMRQARDAVKAAGGDTSAADRIYKGLSGTLSQAAGEARQFASAMRSIGEALPDISARVQMERQLLDVTEQYQNAMKTASGARDRVAVGQRYDAARAGIQEGLDSMLTASEHARQSYQIELQALKAKSPEEQAAVARARQMLELSGQQIDPSQKLAMVQQAGALAYAQALQGITDADKERLRAANDNVRQAQLDLELIGKGVEETERLRFVRQNLAEAESEAARNGTTVSAGYIRAINDLGAAYGKLQAKIAISQLNSSLAFDRSQLGRTTGEQDVASQMRSIYGDDYLAQMGSFEAEQIRINQRLSEMKDVATDVLGGFISDLRQGKSLMEALGNALNKLADKLVDMAVNQLVSSAFGALGGSTSLLDLINPVQAGGLYANGGVFAGGNVLPFARGGVVDRPTFFPFAQGTGLMGEAGPEAIMPLRRLPNGRLGVENMGGSSGGNVFHFAPQTNISVQGSMDATAMAEIKAFIKRNNSDLIKQVPGAVTRAQKRHKMIGIGRG